MAEIKIRMPVTVDEYSAAVAAQGAKVSQDPGLNHSPDGTPANAQEGRYRTWVSSMRPHTTLLQKVPFYIGAQCGGSVMAAFTLRWILHPAASEGATLPFGSNIQSFLMEIVITFILMFVVAAVATDTRACGELAGIAIGSAVALAALMAGPISGASMNPARSLGPAVASGNYRGLWVYIAGPILGAISGMLAYNCIRLTDTVVQACDKPTKSFRR